MTVVLNGSYIESNGTLLRTVVSRDFVYDQQFKAMAFFCRNHGLQFYVTDILELISPVYDLPKGREGLYHATEFTKLLACRRTRFTACCRVSTQAPFLIYGSANTFHSSIFQKK